MAEPETRSIRLIEDRWATFRRMLEVVAIIAAGAWAFYTFFYQEKIKPAGEPASIGEILRITRLGRDAQRDIIDASFGFRNTGKTEIDIAADGWNVWGIRYGRRTRVQRDDTASTRMYHDTVPVVFQHLIASYADLRAASQGGRPASAILEPGAEFTLHDVIALPRGAYDVVKSEVIAVPVKTAEFGGSTRKRAQIAIIRYKDGAIWLKEYSKDVFETDNSTDFALIP
jgi:hypothetical protein